jgi:hypothetical protein
MLGWNKKPELSKDNTTLKKSTTSHVMELPTVIERFHITIYETEKFSEAINKLFLCQSKLKFLRPIYLNFPSVSELRQKRTLDNETKRDNTL